MNKHGYMYILEDNGNFKRVLKPIDEMLKVMSYKYFTFPMIYDQYNDMNKNIDGIIKELNSYEYDSFIFDTHLLYTPNEDILQPILKKHYELEHFETVSKNEILKTLDEYRDIATTLFSRLEFENIFNIINRNEYCAILETDDIKIELKDCNIAYNINSARFYAIGYGFSVPIYLKKGYKFKFIAYNEDTILIKTIKDKECL